MTAENFVYWLQGFMELAEPEKITKAQLGDIKDHLRLAFKDDIDQRYGDETHQQELSDIHNPPGPTIDESSTDPVGMTISEARDHYNDLMAEERRRADIFGRNQRLKC